MHVLLTAITRIIQYYARIICESRADLLKATKTRKVFLPIFSSFYKINETEEFSTLIIVSACKNQLVRHSEVDVSTKTGPLATGLWVFITLDFLNQPI